MGSSTLFFESLVISSVSSQASIAKRAAIPYLQKRMNCSSYVTPPETDKTTQKSSKNVPFFRPGMWPPTQPSSQSCPVQSSPIACSMLPLSSFIYGSSAKAIEFQKQRETRDYSSSADMDKILEVETVGAIIGANAGGRGARGAAIRMAASGSQGGVGGGSAGAGGVGGGGTDNGGFTGWMPDWCGVIEVIHEAYIEHGPDNSEKSYVDKVFYKLYERGVPCIRERPIFSTENGVSISRGRIDLEVFSKYLFEFKITEPTPKNIGKDSRQLMRYLRTYAEMGKPVERAAVVYMYGGEVRIVDVSIQGDKKHRYSPYGRDT
jgi:hypothetical protein